MPLPDSMPVPDRLKVVVDSLNVRRTPTLGGAIIGSLGKDDIVEPLGVSSDGGWQNIRKGELVGWSSARYLVPSTPETSVGTLDGILQIASTSAVASYRWKNRGLAPLGYIKGMAMVFARVYCKLQGGDAAVLEMAKANTGDRGKDVLAWYAQQFRDAGMDNEASGVSTLRHLFVLLIGLGMRESGGKYCEGRDRSASNATAKTAEAGLFQMSFDATEGSPLLRQLFDHYQANPSGFVDVFKEGVRCRASDLQNFGSGQGRDFQRLSKECPAFAVEFAAAALRSMRKHWGPVNRREAEIRPECNTMLVKVQNAVDASGLCPALI